MGNFDGVKYDNNEKDDTKFSPNDFHFLTNVLHISKNLKFILHKSQYSDKFTITNDILDLNKDKIEINPKSIVKIDATSGAPQGTIMVDSNNKLKLNYYNSDFLTNYSDFLTNYNGSKYINIGPGLSRDTNNQMSIALAKCNLKFVNNDLCLDMNAMVNNTSGSITLDDKQSLQLNYSPNDFMKDSTGKVWLKLNDKHIMRSIYGLEINVDNDTIIYDSNTNKLISSIDKYLGVFGQINSGDIYLILITSSG